jgi:xylan 1,4-beta-xylosidase
MKAFIAALLYLVASMPIVSFAEVMAPNPFKTRVLTDEPVTYLNPVIPGFYSDPSAIRVGDDYYLITSTFEYFPGVPIFHSKDLVNWKQIGHAIHRNDQFTKGLRIFAATLRYNDGTFYMITTNVGLEGNFIVTAKDPAGPWSDPIFVDAPGIDPDLFFDDDGKAYYVGSDFELFEIDVKTGQRLSETRKIWTTDGGRYPEGPHIYKKDGWYYLMASEGGTEEAHNVVIARSHDIWGPYYSNPANPIIAHANAAGQQNPIQGVGHADMVEAHDGSWWVVYHGYRTVANGGIHHTLGRETVLAPVDWPKNGWPQVNGNGVIQEQMRVPTLKLKPFKKPPVRTQFNKALSLEWNHVQVPVADNYSFSRKKGHLSLRGAAAELGVQDRTISPTFVGRRVQHQYFRAETKMEFEPKGNKEAAGMTLLNHGTNFDFFVKNIDGKRVLQANFEFENLNYKSKAFELSDGPVFLRIEGERSQFVYSFSQDGESYTEVDRVSARYLSSETLGGFTGVYVGLYATGYGQLSETFADYDWFDYIPK